MEKNPSRRTFFGTAVAAAGVMAASGAAYAAQKNQIGETTPGFLRPWSAPADLKRDLTPGKTPIRLASWSSTTTLDYSKELSPEQLVKRIREAGYTSGNAYCPPEGSPWQKASEAEIKELKDALKKYDVTFFDLHTVVNNIHPDMAEREKAQRVVIKAVETADRLGCPLVTTHTGTCSPISCVTIHPDNWTMKAWKESVAAIRRIIRDTSGMNAVLGIEAVNLTASNNPRAHKQLIEEIGSPRIKVVLDPVNMISLGTYCRNTELIQECFEILGENIMCAHAKDSLITPNMMTAYMTEVAAGKGVIDYETYLVGFSRLKFPRTLLIEHLPDDQYAGAKKFIEDTAAKVGVKFYA